MTRQKGFIDTLKYELGMATKWSRPSISILSANNPFQFLHCAHLASLAANSVGLNLVHLYATPNQYDLPIAIRQFGKIAESLFLCTGLDNGGGGQEKKAYKALNIRREWLVEDGMKVIVSGSKREVTRIAQDAPDFWAFRHHVFTAPRLRRPLSPMWMLSLGLFKGPDQSTSTQLAINPAWIEDMGKQHSWFNPNQWRESLVTEYLRRYVTSSIQHGLPASEVMRLIGKERTKFSKKFLRLIPIHIEETSRGLRRGESR